MQINHPWKNLLTIILLIFIVFSYGVSKAGVQEKIELDDIPKHIIDAIAKKLPKSKVISANIETEPDGSFVYEIQGILEDGRKFEFDAFENGKIEEIEIEFPQYMVPGAVTKAVQKQFPGFKPTFIEASHSASMKVARYEMVGTFQGKTLDLEVSADGSKIVIADQ